uniref:Uncharacterized protein n=1 Tax=Nelumbo nucifera TaxID=4432 RepID=A0A822YQS5_NELNU|nr:TPA_asm: hypothetical protein HUJ06_012236 [Nelumbo nucifera]
MMGGFSMFLSHNQLSGEIPKSLGQFNVSRIDLSYNNLVGDTSILFRENERSNAGEKLQTVLRLLFFSNDGNNLHEDLTVLLLRRRYERSSERPMRSCILFFSDASCSSSSSQTKGKQWPVKGKMVN